MAQQDVRRLTDPNDDDVINWTEKVTDPNGQSVDIDLFVNEVIRDGQVIDSNRRPSSSVPWLSVTTTSNTTQSGATEVSADISVDTSQIQIGTEYKLELEASDSNNTTPKQIDLRIGQTVTTTTATADFTSATLSGTLDTLQNRSSVNLAFDYGPTGNVTANRTPFQTVNSTGNFSQTITGLDKGVGYEYRIVSAGQVETVGDTKSFTTDTVSTSSVTPTGSTSFDATGNFVVDEISNAVDVGFEYSTDTSFSQEISAGSVSSGSFTATANGLIAGATYNVRAYADFEGSRFRGQAQSAKLGGISFGGAPSVTSKTTSSVTAEVVVDELKASTTTDILITYSEQGGTDSGSVVAETISQTKTVSAQITGLNVGSTYDLQAEATVDGSTFTSATQSVDLPSLAVSTKPNTATSATAVTLNGSLDSLESGEAATVSFEYGSAAVDDNETSGQSLSSTGDFSKEVTGLAADTQYEYRVKGVEGSDTDLGQIQTFTTDTIAVSTEAPSSIGAGAATLEGQIDALASSQSGAAAFFEYGKQSGSVTDNSTAVQTGLSQGDPISQSVTGLEPGATYEVRVVATANPSGESKTSPVQTFTTDNITVSTTTATSAGSTSFDATGNLDVNETGGSVSVGFEYSTDMSFSQETGAGTAASGSFNASASGLTAGTTYNVRAYAESGGSRVVGPTVQVTTRNITVSTEPATSVNVGSATLEGNVDNLQSGGGSVQFEYGKTQGFGSTTVLTTVSSTGSFSEDITGLQRNEQYFYRIRGESGGDVDTGSAQSFTTDNISVSTVTPPPSKTVSSLTLRAEVDTFTGDGTITAGIELVESGNSFSGATVKSGTLTSTGTVEKQFTGLSENTSYDFKAFAEVDGVRVEGSVKTDSTLSTTMSISPTSFNFGTSDGPSTKTFTVTNTGTASLSGLSASGLGGDFSEGGVGTSTLSPGGSTNVTVTYDPSSISDDSDTLNISANETASASASVSGSGVPEDPSISVSPSSHDFGTASTTETKQFTITNDGNTDLGSVSASGLGGDFSSNSVQDSFLTPGEQTTITVSYDPTSTASDSDTLSITTDSPDASANLGVAVNGDGIPKNPDVSVSPTSFDFGTASGSETKQFTVTNDGNIDLTGLSASGLGGDFSEGGVGTSTLSPGSDTTVTVTYDPSSISSDNDTLNISANESTSASANVSGDGIPENPQISISLTSKNFGTGSGSQTFTLTNDGNVDLGNVSASGLSGDFSENGVSDSFLTPGEQTTVTVSYNPSSINSDNDTLNISTDRAASASASVSGDGIPENPSISISPNSHDFGTGSGSKTFTLENTGNVDLGSVSASGLSGDFSDQSVADSFLTPGETTTVTVDYNPSSIASDSDTLNISTDRAASASANVSGDGVPENPSISISSTSFDFGEVSSSDTKQFTIENTGNVDLGSVSASGLSGDFSENGVGDSLLTPGETTNITVTYTPDDINSDSDTLDISTDRTASASATVSGDGIPENPSISISPTSFDFGTASGSESKTFTIENTGNVDLGSVSASGLSGDFSQNGVQDSTLTPGQQTTVTVGYNPSSIASDSDTLNISTDRTASASASVSGDGVPENPQISVSPSSHNFGTASGSESKTFTVTNTGNVDLGSVSAGGLSGDFSENGVGNSFLTPDETTNVTVTYTPNDVNSDSDTLDISTDRTASASASVSGDGVPENPSASISPTSKDFGTGSGTQSFTLSNDGNVDLTGISASVGGDFSLNSQPSSPLSPSNNTSFGLSYGPSDTSSDSDTLVISANEISDINVPVSGDGDGQSITVANATYNNVVFSFSIIANSTKIAFNNDGTKMFVVGNSIDSVYEYDLPTGFDVSTVSYSSEGLSVTNQDLDPQGVSFSSDGTKMFMVGNSSDSVYEYDLTTGFDLSTASYSNRSFNIGTEDFIPRGIRFNGDGTKMFMVGSNSASIYEYNLYIGFDLSTASYSGTSFGVIKQTLNPTGIAFSSDGTKMFMVENSNSNVYEYNLSTGFDLSTASYSGTSFGVANQDLNPRGVSLSSDGTKMFMVGSNTNTVYQYDL
jgi:hypothetical protein